ncbi:divergent polysaccharide deacetylase family protein [Paenibacillus macerans]|uniref:divergent polysaccharide deacetylase family protein n=1 Tax=Paenibacillus macerans TaxID=44252 RepID=UPI003D32045B
MRDHPKFVRILSALIAGCLASLLPVPLGGSAETWASPAAAGTERASHRLQDGAAASPKAKGRSRKLAVIIDDLGNHMGGTDDIIAMPVKLTVAVMPFLKTSQEDARRAHEHGHDVIVHLPMEPKQGQPEWLGPGAILSGMTDAEIRKRVDEAIDQVPYAAGINNHMGSKVTGDERVMSIIFDVCRERGLFFVDSKTNYWSVIPRLSREKGLPRLENDIFLDDVNSAEHISGQLRKVLELLNERESCVTIGHVGIQGQKTAAVLKKYIPLLQAEGVEFIGITDLAREQISPGVRPGPGFTLP